MVTERVNVYQLPDNLSQGYCFGGGVPIAFLNVDWFDALPEIERREELLQFIKSKRYFIKGRKYLLLGETFAEVMQ
jgi:hypothetical protein